MPDVIQLDDVRSPRYHRNMDREGYGHDGKHNCLLCGRIVDPATKWLRMTVSGDLVKPDAEVPESRDQGMFVVGNGCLRRHPELRDFVIVWRCPDGAEVEVAE
jgi:hypothetical protein